MAVFAPMPNASVRIVMAAYAGDVTMVRSAYTTSAFRLVMSVLGRWISCNSLQTQLIAVDDRLKDCYKGQRADRSGRHGASRAAGDSAAWPGRLRHPDPR